MEELQNLAFVLDTAKIGEFGIAHWVFMFPALALLMGFFLFRSILDAVLDAMSRLFLQLFCKNCGSSTVSTAVNNAGDSGGGGGSFTSPVQPLAPVNVPAMLPLSAQLTSAGAMAELPAPQMAQQQLAAVSQPAMAQIPQLAAVSQPAQMTAQQQLAAVRQPAQVSQSTAVSHQIGMVIASAMFNQQQQSAPSPYQEVPSSAPALTAPATESAPALTGRAIAALPENTSSQPFVVEAPREKAKVS